jgi:hypothetical protein
MKYSSSADPQEAEIHEWAENTEWVINFARKILPLEHREVFHATLQDMAT